MFNIPENLQKALRKQNVVILAGAGVSLYANYPSWKELIIQIYKKLVNDYDDKLNLLIPAIEQDVLGIFEALEKIKKYDSVAREVLKEQLNNIPNIELTLHKEITNVSRKVITTNYDRLFEKATNIDVVFPNSKFELARLIDSEEYIFKVHGSIDNVAGCILFKEDYQRVYNSPDIATVEFKNTIMNNTILCIGFSMSDPYVIDIFKTINTLYEGYRKDNYIITTDDSDFTQYNFQTIRLDSYGQLPLVLKQLSGLNNKPHHVNSHQISKGQTTKRFLRRRCRYSPIGSKKFIDILTELTTLKIGAESIDKYNSKILELEPEFEQKIAYAAYNENISKTDEMLRILKSFKSSGKKESVRLLFLGIALEKLDKIDEAISCYQKILASEDDIKLLKSAQFNINICFEKKDLNENIDFTRFFKDEKMLLGKQRIKDKALTMHLIHCRKENRPFLHNKTLEDSLNYEVEINPIGYVKTMLSYMELSKSVFTENDLKQLIEIPKEISMDTRIAILVKLHNQLDASENELKNTISKTLNSLIKKYPEYTTTKHIADLN